MSGIVDAIRCLVKVRAPAWFNPRTRTVHEATTFGFEVDATDDPLSNDLESVTLQRSVGQPCGTFQLTFSPREVAPGYTWADLIPGYSLVEIWLQRYPQNPEPVLAMLGLTGGAVRTAILNQQQPQRTVAITGRELSCVLVDQQLLTLPAPPVGVPCLDVATQQVGDLPALYTPERAILGTYALDPELAFKGDNPIAVVDKFVRMVTEGIKSEWNPDGLPLLNLRLPGAVISDLLRFLPGRATLFDPSAKLPASSTLTAEGQPLWNVLAEWSDPAYQELWSRTVDPARSGDTGRPFVEVVFRKLPFAGAIDANGALVGVAPERGTQFDREWLADPLNTVEVDEADVQVVELRNGVADMHNLYYVYPQSPAINNAQDFRAVFQPVLDNALLSPSSAPRYGVRMLQVHDRYFSDGPAGATALVQAQTRARLLWAWHRFNPLFLNGSITLRGDATLDCGRRLRWGTYEAYIQGVTHRFGATQLGFTTDLTLTRGWPLGVL